jgi:uncharacterized protein with HEPN domain
VRSDRERLLDMLDAIERLQRHANRGRSAFDQDEVLQAAVVRWVEIVGEAARSMSPELLEAHPQVPWRRIAAMRNLLVHAYFEIDTDAVWFAVTNELSGLEIQLRSILQRME